jgi:DNA-binding transcriptional MerR regulator
MKTTKLSGSGARGVVAVLCFTIGWMFWSSGNAFSGDQAPAPNLSPGLKEIVKLAQAHMGDDVILPYIKRAGASYTLSADDILYLKDQGVSQNVISVLLQSKSAGSANPVPPPPPTAEPPSLDSGNPTGASKSDQLQPDHMVTLDVNQVFQEYSKTKRFQAEIKEEADTFSQKLQTLTKQGTSTQALEEYRKAHQKILNDDKMQMWNSVVQDIQKVVVQYAHANGLLVVYDKSGNFVPFFWSQQFGMGGQVAIPKSSSSAGADITDKIIEILNMGSSTTK